MEEVITSIVPQVVVGVDGCAAGWIAVYLTGEADWRVEIFENISALWNQCKKVRLILIDIPIGLWEDGPGERECDKAARRLLGQSRGSSVFPIPCREAIHADLMNASDINKKRTGRRLSKQTLGIIPKIRQVDKLLTNDHDARAIIKEVHPELCFWALNGGRPMKHGKKDGRGLSERRQVLKSVCSFTDNLVDDVLDRYRGQVKEDDVLDALVAALSASTSSGRLSTIPNPPEIDSKGLPMQMVYSVRAN